MANGTKFEWKPGHSPDELKQRVRLLERKAKRNLEEAMQQAVLLVEADAKKNAPVDTGRLRADISSIVERIGDRVVRGYVGNNVDYAIYVEMEIQKEGLAYLGPALEANIDKIRRLFERALDDAAREASR